MCVCVCVQIETSYIYMHKWKPHRYSAHKWKLYIYNVQSGYFLQICTVEDNLHV